MTISDSATINDLNLYLKVSHTWVGELSFTLDYFSSTDPGVGPITIVDRPGIPASFFGCSGDNMDVTVNDEGINGSVESQCDVTSPAIHGSWVGGDPTRPVLANFDGKDINGYWNLSVADNALGDLGTLVEWCLEYNTEAAVFASCGGYDIYENGPGTYTAPSFAGNLIAGTNDKDGLIGTAGPDLILGLEGR